VEAGWDRALRTLAEATGSARGQLIGIGGPAVIPFNIVTDMDEDVLRSFVEIDGGSAARNFRVAASRGPLEIVHDEHYRTAQSLLKDDVYNDFCRDHDIPHGIQTVLEQTRTLLIGLSVNRTARDGPSNADERSIFAAAAPHALRAVRIQQAMEGHGTQLLSGSLEAMSVAALVLDCAGSVRAMTGPAEAELLSGDRLGLFDGHLRATRWREQAQLDSALAAALRRPGRSTSLSLAGAPGAGGAPLAMSFHPIGPDAQALGFAPKALVVLHRQSGREPEAELLRAAYGLTATEAAIAVQLARGMDREEIARARGVSGATVHTQIKSIFGKVGVSREVELVLAVARLARL